MFSADICAIANGLMSEYETKISMADFRADFSKSKHKFYNEFGKHTPQYGEPDNPGWIPHHFYFVIPESLADVVSAKLLSYPNYGLIVVKKVANAYKLREAPIVLKRAKKLHSNEISPSVYKQFLYRMGSELASLSSLKLKEKGGSHEEEQSREETKIEPEVTDASEL